MSNKRGKLPGIKSPKPTERPVIGHTLEDGVPRGEARRIRRIKTGGGKNWTQRYGHQKQFSKIKKNNF